jgi:hypothetical protein
MDPAQDLVIFVNDLQDAKNILFFPLSFRLFTF